MKADHFFNFIIKIIGVIALWKAVQYFGLLIASLGILFRGSNIIENAYSLGMLIMTLLPFVFSLSIGLYLLLRTQKVLNFFQFNEQDEVRLNVESPAFYRVIVLVAGFVLLIHGASNAFSMTYSYNTRYDNSIQQNVNQNQWVGGSDPDLGITTTNSKMDVNYFGLIEIFLGLLFLVHWRKALSKGYLRNVSFLMLPQKVRIACHIGWLSCINITL